MKTLALLGGLIVISLIAFGVYSLITNLELKSLPKKENENEKDNS